MGPANLRITKLYPFRCASDPRVIAQEEAAGAQAIANLRRFKLTEDIAVASDVEDGGGWLVIHRMCRAGKRGSLRNHNLLGPWQANSAVRRALKPIDSALESSRKQSARLRNFSSGHQTSVKRNAVAIMASGQPRTCNRGTQPRGIFLVIHHGRETSIGLIQAW